MNKDNILSIYVEEPSLDTGHVYIGIKNKVTKANTLYHFSPKNAEKALAIPFVSSSSIKENANSVVSDYDTRIDIDVSDEQLNKIEKAFEENKDKKYSLLAFNCYHFSKKIVEAAGLPFPQVRYMPTAVAASKAIKRAEKIFNDTKLDMNKKAKRLKKNFFSSKKSPAVSNKEKEQMIANIEISVRKSLWR